MSVASLNLEVDELEEMRSQLAQMVDEHALRWESVTLSSGKRSPYYFDSKQILHRADGARAVGELAFEALKKYEIRAVGGLTMGADPVAAAVIRAALDHGVDWTSFSVRKEAKKHGLQQWIEGPFVEEGMPVAVVDDVLTTGKSLLTAIDRIEGQGPESSRSWWS